MQVLINGSGNIGITLIQVLTEFRELLGIKSILLHKRTQNLWNTSEIKLLEEKGICVIDTKGFEKSLGACDYIFEATPNGVGLQNQQLYEKNNVKACAQGSEKGFGIPYISGVNDDMIMGTNNVQVLSCNTHATNALLQAFGGDRLQNIVSADMVVVRRSEDIGNHTRLVSGNVVARHLDQTAGTHHAIDALALYNSLGIEVNLTSSDITTPSQFMHAVRFNLSIKAQLPSLTDIEKNHPYLGFTQKFDSNVIFEMGRRFGFAGRLFQHAIIVASNLLVTENQVKGWAFVPQEGNTILSTINAFLLQTKNPQWQKIMHEIRNTLLLRNI